MSESKKLKITFAPGEFDNLEGSLAKPLVKPNPDAKKIFGPEPTPTFNLADMLENGEEDLLEAMLENLVNQQARKLQ
jgi:hypothetical protein